MAWQSNTGTGWATELMNRKGLTRCPMCPGTNPVVGADIPACAKVLCIGSKPGKEENNRGKPFIGQTGKELNEHYLPLAGLSRDTVGFTNTTKCYHELPDDGDKAIAISQSCAMHHLRQEIKSTRPSVIIPMGSVACSQIESIQLEIHHGIPMEGFNWFGHTATIFPTQHPALGLRSTEMMKPLRDDFISLGKYLRGEYEWTIDRFGRKVDYRDLATADEVDDVFDNYANDIPMAVDTETDPDEGFWCSTFSMMEGTGYMVRRSNKKALARWRDRVHEWKGVFAFQNGMFDLPVLEEVGVIIPMQRFDDTMVRSYHLQYLPQGLKAMAFRLCGMVMEDFEDVVLPYSVEVMLDFIMKLSDVDWPKPEAIMVPDGKGGEKSYKAQGLNTKIKRLLTDYSKKPGHKIFKRWDEWSWEERAPAIGQFGMLPRASIKYVPLERAIWYACRDADSTLRVRNVLIRLARQLRSMN